MRSFRLFLCLAVLFAGKAFLLYAEVFPGRVEVSGAWARVAGGFRVEAVVSILPGERQAMLTRFGQGEPVYLRTREANIVGTFRLEVLEAVGDGRVRVNIDVPRDIYASWAATRLIMHEDPRIDVIVGRLYEGTLLVQGGDWIIRLPAAANVVRLRVTVHAFHDANGGVIPGNLSRYELWQGGVAYPMNVRVEMGTLVGFVDVPEVVFQDMAARTQDLGTGLAVEIIERRPQVVPQIMVPDLFAPRPIRYMAAQGLMSLPPI